MMITEGILTKPEAPWLLLTKGHKKRALPKGFSIFELDALQMKNLNGFYDEISSALKMPDYFGRNFNALDECLTDLEWLSSNGYLIVVRNAELLLSDETFDSLEGLLSIFSKAGKEWAIEVNEGNPWDRKAIPFHVILEISEDADSDSIVKYQNMEPPIAFIQSD